MTPMLKSLLAKARDFWRWFQPLWLTQKVVTIVGSSWFIHLGIPLLFALFAWLLFTPTMTTAIIGLVLGLVTKEYALYIERTHERGFWTALRVFFLGDDNWQRSFVMFLMWGIFAWCAMLIPVNYFVYNSWTVNNGQLTIGSRTIATTFFVLLPTLIGLSIAHWALQYKWRKALIRIVGGIVVAWVMANQLPVLISALTSWTPELPDEWRIVMGILLTINLYLALFGLVIIRRIGFTPILRILTLGFVSGTLAASILVYPVYSMIYNQFVPQQTIELGNMPLIAGIVCITLFIGSGILTARLVRHDSYENRVRSGLATGIIAGFVVFAGVVGTGAGIAGHGVLYNFVISREGYTDAEWVLKLGRAINQTVPMMSLAFFGSLGGAALLSTIGTLIVPFRAAKTQPKTTPSWVIYSLIVASLSLMVFMTIIVVFNILDDTLNNIFITYGYHPTWSPFFSTAVVALPSLLLTAIPQLAVIRWLTKQTQVSSSLKRYVYVSVIAQIITSAALMLATDSHLVVGIAIWLIGWAVITVNQLRQFEHDNAVIEDKIDASRWLVQSIAASLSAMITGWLMVAVALAYVLIAVVLIVDLSETTAPAPGLPYLLDNLNINIMATTGVFAVGIQTFLGAGFLLGTFLMLDMPSAVSNRYHALSNHPAIPSIMKRRTVWVSVALIMAIGLDIAASTFIITLLWAVLVLTQKRLAQLPIILVGLAVLVTFGVVPLLATATGLGATLLLISLTLAGFMSYQALALYLPQAQQTQRYVVIAVIIGLMTVTLSALRLPQAEVSGGVSVFDGARWDVLNQDNSSLGSNIPMAMLQDNQGQLWFINAGHTISTYDGDQWSIATVKNVDASSLTSTIDGFEELVNRQPYLTQDGAGNLWFAINGQIGQLPAANPSTHVYEVLDLCIHSATDTPRIAPCTTSNNNAELQLDGFVATSDGSLWYSVDGKAARLTPDAYQALATASSDSVATALPTPITGVRSMVAIDNTVWFATDTGLYSYDTELSQITSDPAHYVIIADDATVWFATDTGLWQLADANSPVRILTMLDIAPDAADTVDITALDFDSAGNLWMGTTQGLMRYTDTLSDTFTSANSGLVVDTVHNVIVDAADNVWVLTLETTEQSANQWLFWALWAIFGFVSGSVIYRDYRQSPSHSIKKRMQNVAHQSDTLYAEAYAFLAENPTADMVAIAVDTFNQVSLPHGGAILSALQQLQLADEPTAALQTVIDTLADNEQQSDALLLKNYYDLLLQAIQVKTIQGIGALELVVNPAASGNISISTQTTYVKHLPDMLATTDVAIWQSLGDVALNIRKYTQVNDTGDRLSYLAAALVAIEQAQQKTGAIPRPNRILFEQLAQHWRSLINQSIETLSGSATLRLELRTRQIQRGERVTLVVYVQNVGRSAAEKVRVMRLAGTDVADVVELERLSAGQSESLEFVLTPAATDNQRIQFKVLWHDRLAQDKAIEYADVVEYLEARAEFKLIANPYIVGHPVKFTQMFFGREDVFQFIEQNLIGVEQNQTIVLYGQRRTGKTSLLYQLVNGRLGDGIVAALIDMQALVMLVDSTADFLDEIAYQLRQSLADAGIVIDAPAESTETTSAKRMFNRFVDRVCQVLGTRKLLLIFDEFELIEGKITDGKLDKNILDYFRSLIQHRSNLVFIFTGTHRLEEMSHDYWSILFNIALSRKISFLSESDTRALICNPVADDLIIDDLAVEKITRLTSGHPYFTQLMCWALVNQCNEVQRNYATINDVNDALDTMLTTGESHFAYIWKQVSANEQLILAAMAFHTQDSWLQPDDILALLQQHGFSDIERTDLLALLDALATREILEGTADSVLRYRFRLDVLQQWIKRNKSLPTLLA